MRISPHHKKIIITLTGTARIMGEIDGVGWSKTENLNVYLPDAGKT